MQRTEFVVQLAYEVLALVLQRHDLAQQAAITLAQSSKRAGESVGLLGSLADFRGEGGAAGGAIGRSAGELLTASVASDQSR